MAIFQVRLQPGISLVSSDAYGKDLSFGRPTANSYLIEGERLAVLFDLAVEEPGLHDFVLSRIRTPLMTVISHGHPDHIFHIGDFREIWLHEEDRDFPLREAAGIPLIPETIKLRFLRDGVRLDLGGRELRVIHIPGHTMGSIMLLDSLTGTLLSGDSVARRILYGVNRCPPLNVYCQRLQALRRLDIRHIYSAHDRADLGPEAPERILAAIRERLPYCTNHWEYSSFPAMLHEVVGEESEPGFLDIAAAESLVQEAGCYLKTIKSEEGKTNV